MIEICLKDDNMHIFVMIDALICINNYVITCINSMFSMDHRDHATSQAKKKCMKRHPSDLDLMLRIHFH